MILNKYHQDCEKEIAEDIISKGAYFILVSNGSYHPTRKVGASAWIIESSSNINQCMYSDNIIPGSTEI